MIRFIHVADIHASTSRTNETLEVLALLKERCNKGDVDFILFAGDFWDFTISNSKQSGFSLILKAFFELQEITPCYMIYGTPTHEADGSLECFALMPNVNVFDCEHAGSYIIQDEGVKLTVIPEPRLSFFNGKDINEKYSLVQNWYKKLVDESKKKEKCQFHIVMFHGDVEGSTYQNGIVVEKGNTTMPKSILNELKADYIACGHIHQRSCVKGIKSPSGDLNCWYSGSVPPKNFGETHNGGWIEVTLGG